MESSNLRIKYRILNLGSNKMKINSKIFLKSYMQNKSILNRSIFKEFNKNRMTKFSKIQTEFLKFQMNMELKFQQY
jgi:ribosomal protein L16 Arg81 hydroxylase